MPYRVVHCGTGNIGAVALRTIIEHPDLELVGHFVSSPDKAGRDSGELVGLGPTGVVASDDWAPLLELGADCLTYFGNSIGREADAINDAIPFLERGTNVVTFSGFALAHPNSAPSEFRDPIEDACRRGSSTCYFTGIDPGWATTDLAIASLAVANRVDCVRVMELGWWGDYTAEFVCREYFGFGKPPGFQPLLVTGGFIETMWEPTLQQLAEVLDVEIEETRVLYETDCLDHDVQTGFGTVAAGTASVVHFEYQALSGGKPFVVVEHVDCVARDVGKQWKQPHGPVDLAFRVAVEGDPSYSVELCLGEGGDVLTAMPVINAVPAVCAARPGLLGPLDIPRYWGKNTGAKVEAR
ncbi:MAG: dihydrodipicolinate reductase [Actinomycetota bacterium]|nr:dihydrodipicolinate reductase [Actinomycetota bacterium]